MNEHSDRELRATVAILEKIKLQNQKGCVQERGQSGVQKCFSFDRWAHDIVSRE